MFGRFVAIYYHDGNLHTDQSKPDERQYRNYVSALTQINIGNLACFQRSLRLRCRKFR
jgi:hypothetical protein